MIHVLERIISISSAGEDARYSSESRMVTNTKGNFRRYFDTMNACNWTFLLSLSVIGLHVTGEMSLRFCNVQFENQSAEHGQLSCWIFIRGF